MYLEVKMKSLQPLIATYKADTLKALGHLEYSFEKVKKLSTDPKKLDEETLETWESFSARFARVADLYLTKYLRAHIQVQDPGFQGSFRDSVDFGEKLGLIDSADDWMEIRALRNITAHEYTNETLEAFFNSLIAQTPRILAIREGLEKE